MVCVIETRMYANVKVVGRGVIFLGGKSPRWVIVRGVN